MRNLLWLIVAVALAAPPLAAAEQGRPMAGPQDDQGQPPGPPPGGGPGGGFGGPPPGPPPDGRMGPFRGGQTVLEIFDAARKTVQLSDDAKAGVNVLETQFTDDLEAAISDARRKLSREYVAKILPLLPDAEKPKFEAVAKALDERDEAVATAQKELKAVLNLVKTSQGADKARAEGRARRGGPPGSWTDSKEGVLLTCFVLNEQQQGVLETIRRENFDTTRQRMDQLFARLRNPGGPPDPDAFREVGQAMRQVREEIDDETAALAAAILTPEQKKDYTTACAAIDTCRKKAKEAEAACRKKIIEVVGEEKATALLGAPPGQAAKPRKATEF